MTPVEFFEKVTPGSRIRYDKDQCMNVRIMFVSRLCGYAVGRQIGTKRRVYLILSNGMLRDGIRGAFNSVELFK